MKITVKHKDTSIIVDESDSRAEKDKTYMKWGDQVSNICLIIDNICDNILKLQNDRSS